MSGRRVLNATITVLVAASCVFSTVAAERQRITKINGDQISGDIDVVTDVDFSGIIEGTDTNAVLDIVNDSFDGGTQNVNRVTHAFDGIEKRVIDIESRTNDWNSAFATNDLRRVEDMDVYERQIEFGEWDLVATAGDEYGFGITPDFIKSHLHEDGGMIVWSNRNPNVESDTRTGWWVSGFNVSGEGRYDIDSIPLEYQFAGGGSQDVKVEYVFEVFIHDTETGEDDYTEYIAATYKRPYEVSIVKTGDKVATTGGVAKVVRSIIDGSARPLPAYLHALDFADSYPDAAKEYYRSRNGGDASACASVRNGNTYSRNFDFPFDDRAEFVVKMAAGAGRFASVGVAQVGTNLTEAIVTSGKPSKWYKALPGATVDGINEHGVVVNINVVDGDPHEAGWPTTGAIHCLGAVRWVLDNATNAVHGAEYIAANIHFPEGWTQNYHYMIADETDTYIVENGTAYPILGRPVMTNFRIAVEPPYGPGVERYNLLMNPANNITNAWFTNAYRRETNPPWVSDLNDVLAYTNEIFNAWASHPKEYFRNKTNNGQPWWQSIHTSVYDISNRVLRVAVQEKDDWYTFAVPSAGGVDEEAVKEIVQPMIEANERIGEDDQIVRGHVDKARVWNIVVLSAGSATCDEEDNNIVITYARKDETAEAISQKRDETDNVCHLTEGEIGRSWDFSEQIAIDPTREYSVRLEGKEQFIWVMDVSDYDSVYSFETYDSKEEAERATEISWDDAFEPPDGYRDTKTVRQMTTICKENELFVTPSFVNAATNAMEGLGTVRQIVRGPRDGDIWGIIAEDAMRASDSETATYAKNDWDGNDIIETYARKDEVAYQVTTEPIPASLANKVSYIHSVTHEGETHDEDENGSVVIGKGAVGTVDPNYIRSLTNATEKVELRSMAVAIGMNARAQSVTGDKAQAIAIGANTRAIGPNAIAIGSGAKHWYETDDDSSAAVATGSQAIAIGYAAKAYGVNAMQLGKGVNNEPNSLKYLDTTIVKDGKVQATIDHFAVTAMTNSNGTAMRDFKDLPVDYIVGGKTWEKTKLTSVGVYGMTFGNGLFVAGSYSTSNAGLWYSTNGLDWAQGDKTDGGFEAVCYGDGMFVASSSTDEGLWYSTNGINWSQGSATAGNWGGIAYGDGHWVAAGKNSNGLWCSTNGIEWTQSAKTDFNWWGVCYGDGRFVASSGDNKGGGMWYSDDNGETWTQSNLTTSNDKYRAIAYGSGRFVTGNGSYAKEMLWSEDGATWHTATGSSIRVFGMVYARGRFLAAGYTAGLYYSDDGGETWVASDPVGVNGYWYGLAYGYGRVLAGSISGASKGIWHSDDRIIRDVPLVQQIKVNGELAKADSNNVVNIEISGGGGGGIDGQTVTNIVNAKIETKRDLTNNVCKATEGSVSYSKWVAVNPPAGFTFNKYQPKFEYSEDWGEGVTTYLWGWYDDRGDGDWEHHWGATTEDPNPTSLRFGDSWIGYLGVDATLRITTAPICKAGERFVTPSFVTNVVGYATDGLARVKDIPTVTYDYALGEFYGSLSSGEIRSILAWQDFTVQLNLGNSDIVSADCALWVDASDAAEDVRITSFSGGYTLKGDDGYSKITAGKCAIITFTRVTSSVVIVAKKEF